MLVRGRGAIHEQAHGGGLQGLHRGKALIFRRSGQRLDTPDGLALSPQRLAAGAQDNGVRRPLQDHLDQLG